MVCECGLCIKAVLYGQSSLSSKAKVLCSICTNTIFSITYFSKKNGFLSFDLGKKKEVGTEKQVNITQSAPKNRQNRLSDDLSRFKGRKKSCRSSVWAWRCQQPDDYCFFLKRFLRFWRSGLSGFRCPPVSVGGSADCLICASYSALALRVAASDVGGAGMLGERSDG